MDTNTDENEILNNEILLLIMDYLYSTNLINSFITIEQETKKSIFSYNKELSFLRKLIMKGNWNESENFLLPLKSNPLFEFSSAIYFLKLQKFFEATETDSSSYDQNEIELQLKDIRNYTTEEQFKEVLNLLNKNSIKDDPKYRNWTVSGGRLKTFEKIRELFGNIYPINKEKEKIIKDNLLYKLFFKICGNGKMYKNKLINEITSIINNEKKINNNNNYIANEKKIKNNNDNNIKNNNKINDVKKNETIDKKKNNIKEKQKEKIRPQSSTGTKNIKQNKNFNDNNNDKNYSEFNNNNFDDNISSNFKINNNQNEINIENANISNVPNYNETSSLIKDTKKIIKNLSEINNNNNKTNTILAPNKIHQKIESPYDLYSYDPSSFSMDSLLVDSHAIRAISFSPNGNILSLGTNSKSLKLYDFSPINEKFLRHNSCSDDFISLKLLFEKPNHHAGSIYCLDFSPNDKLIATGSNDKMIKVFVVPDFTSNMTEILELAIPDQKGTVRSVIFPPTEDSFFFSGGSGTYDIYLWDTESGKKKSALIQDKNDLEVEDKTINSLKFSVDENSQTKLLGSCGNNILVCFHDYRVSNPVNSIEIKGHGEINDITFTNDFICSAHNDGYICLYNNCQNNTTQNIVKEVKVSNKELRAVNFSKDGKYILTASFDNKISIFDMNDDLKHVKHLEHDDRAVNCIWHPDKPIIVSSYADKTARIWSPKIY